MSIYNLKGTVNVVMDLLGYYAPTPGRPARPGATGATGPIGLQGLTGLHGVDGAQGPQGVASPVPQPLYFYASNAVAETVPAWWRSAIWHHRPIRSIESASNGWHWIHRT